MAPRKNTKRSAAPLQQPAAKCDSTSSTDDSSSGDWEKKTVAVLRDLCQKRGLDTKGIKAVLVKRLTEYENGEEEDDDEEPSPTKLKRQDSDNTKIKKAFAKSVKEESKTKKQLKPDSHCPMASSVLVLEDYDCTLNQTNINANNNKFYIIQTLYNAKTNVFYVWTRWGRVGEPGQNKLIGPIHTSESAVDEFKKKFKDKTKNDWDKRTNFVVYSGKYTLLEIEDADVDDVDITIPTSKKETEVHICLLPVDVDGLYSPCTLDPVTMELIKLLFDEDMFTDSMTAMDLDVKKMPLGKLSKAQISKGFDALVAIEDAIKEMKPKAELEKLTSTFFTLIPHSFGRKRPPLIDTLLLVQKKKDMLMVLSDIEMTLSLQKKKTTTKNKALEPHPLDVKYNLLGSKLSVMKSTEPEFKVIKKYIENTGGSPNWKNLNIWKVDRDGEGERFKKHSTIKNRKLLWHGTNVAVVAAILNSGLRIMPHAGGRVGRGIYFASENAKSRGYVWCASNGVGIMFLNEVALGKEHAITMDDSSLVVPPKGFDCVIARGRQEPDESLDTTISLEGKPVTVPQGKPVPSKYKTSSFHESEYLVYQESQARIRYLLTFTGQRW